MITTYDFIDSNKKKTVLLLLLFPISLAILLFISLYAYMYIVDAYSSININNIHTIYKVLEVYWYYLLIGIVLSTIWTLYSFYYCSDIILNIVNATLPKDNEYKDIKRIVENISIIAGIEPPKLYIIKNEESLNAFAVGTTTNNSAIVLTYGLIQKLEKSELEAVIAHEIAHIVHQDTKLMMTMIFLIGFFTFFGSLLLGIRSRSARYKRKSKGTGIIIVIGVVIYIYGTIVAPLLRFAVSRTREFQADAKSALLTRNPQSLISALKKINRYPIIDSFNRNEIMAPMCIVSPLRIPFNLFNTLSNLSSTHPPINDRIEALEVMDGRGRIKI